MERLDLEVKFQTAEAGLVSGYASVFGGLPDSYGDVIAPGAYAASLKAHREAGTMPLLLWQHDPAQPVGRWLDLKEDAHGLHVSGQLILEAEKGREAHALLKGKALNGLSIGYRVIDFDRQPGGGRLLKQIELIEISLVSIPAAPAARITSVKSASADNTATQVAIKRTSKMADQETAAPEAEADRIGTLEETVTEVDTRLTELEKSVGNVAKSAERIEQKLNRPGAGVETKAAPEKTEVKAFAGFLRHGREALPVDEVKALRVADDTTGGYLAPDQFVAEVIKGIVEISPVRQAARVGSTAAGSVILPKRTGQPTASWVGETEARPETGASYGQVEIPVHEMACYVDVSLRLLEDAAVNVEAEVSSDLAEEFGRLEGAALVNGNGVKKPLGFLQDAAVSYTPTGNASTLGAAPADTLIDFIYAMPAFYRNAGTWMMNGTTLAAIRKLKSGDGTFLWQPSFRDGEPETILGRPVIEAPDMPDIGTAAEPIAFGDFARAYRIYDRVSLSLMRDPYSQATSGLVRFHARRRLGAGVVLPEAIRKLRCATS
ncbi:phage major capsid protein [Mangrovicoccus sp. HB161399]|uniref:phage major capsid protein n=1 Tax=Mangrovicoccus sp. HB161399 TaxID=2720392 RepID=UPI001555A44F|nr:phage major capsid protein [Mangrovicoccus sp. HB161399]